MKSTLDYLLIISGFNGIALGILTATNYLRLDLPAPMCLSAALIITGVAGIMAGLRKRKQ
jgi:uncharacterized membrane protein HdeD (DUF308 family)